MRTLADMLGGAGFDGSAGAATAALSPPVGGAGQVNSEPLGSLTGAPPHARMQQIPIIPATAIGIANQEPTRIAAAMRQNRLIVCTAPLVPFGIWVGDASVRPNSGMLLPAGLPFDIIIPGLQELYAVTDAPTFLPLQILSAALLVGDKERRAT